MPRGLGTGDTACVLETLSRDGDVVLGGEEGLRARWVGESGQ